MSNSTDGRHARVIPIVPAPDTPCARVLLERTREELCLPYRRIAEQTRARQREYLDAVFNRRAARHPLAWGRALLAQLEARFELAAARSWQKTVAQGLDHEAVHSALGWEKDYRPECSHEYQEPRTLARTATTLLAAAALVITPTKAEHLPLTADQKGDWLAYMALCVSAGSKRPDAPQAPCHAPKIGLQSRRNLLE